MKLSDAEMIRLAGQRMSNWLFNVSQGTVITLTDGDRRLMREMVAEWDRAARLLPRRKEKKRANSKLYLRRLPEAEGR